MRAPAKTFTRARQLRRAMTLPEAALWQLLRRHQLADLRFRRQHPIGPYILDFYSASAKLCIEIDGPSHAEPAQIAHDRQRTRWLEGQGIRVLRFTADQILHDGKLVSIRDAIVQAAAPSTAFGGSPPP